MIAARALTALAQFSTTRTNFWLGFLFDGVMFVVLFGSGITHSGVKAGIVALAFFGGLFVFSFVEYFFHRWLFHRWITIMVKGHQAHHENPLGYDSLPFFVPSLVYLAIAWLLQLLLPVEYALLLAAGFVLGYITYGLTHFILHRHRFKSIIGRKLVAYHQIHHYHPGFNFGVTSPIWDIILGTRYQSGHRRMW